MSGPRCHEHTRTLTIICHGARMSPVVTSHAHFEGSRTAAGRYDMRRCSGFESVGDSEAFLASPPTAAREELVELLSQLCRSCDGRLRVYYSSTSGTRRVAGMQLESVTTTVSAWALTGHLITPSGRRCPIGWSGRGDGREVLRDPGRVAGLRTAASQLEAASSGFRGTLPVVFTPAASAVLLHEAVGHFVEGPVRADIDLRHRIGVAIAAPGFSADDVTTIEGGAARYEFDDDGIASGRTQVLRDGVVVGQLHSLASAAAAGACPTGNGRSSSVWRPTVPRVSNLVFAPGPTPDAHLVEPLEHGLYVHQVSDGWTCGGFLEARLVLAERIRRGRRIGEFVTGGRFREPIGFLRRVDGIGNRCHWAPNAMCGKAGQVLFDVGTCAPAIRFTELEVRQ